MPEIEGGYYIKARKIQESEIAHAPPHVREIWDWLIKEANHKDNGKFKRGQTMRSYNDIRNGLKWHVGFRTERYSKNHCETAMRWLTKRGMIHTAKTTRGMIITIVNYDIYQNPMNYGKYNETYNKHTTNIQSVDTINNNDKNEKNDKNINIPFDMFWQAYDKKRGDKFKLEKIWNNLTDMDRQNIMDYIPKYKIATPDKKYRKDPQTFFNNKSWNDELIGVVIPKPEKKLTLAEKDALFGEVAQ